jgi:hypothetical protein|tara:strand:- start:384 stop:629 length:246 start_codon:yes stop_codon:yes gene_type:complete
MDKELWDVILDGLSLRELQTESARAISTMKADNNSIYKFNKEAHHNSQKWYRAVIIYYCEQHGGFPSEVGPGKDVKLIMED